MAAMTQDEAMVSTSALDCRIALVIGGARSGKSRFALVLAERANRERVFIATAEGLDEEMRERIKRHREERGSLWRTRESPLDLAEALAAEAGSERIVIVDCLTLWLSNLMHAGRSPAHEIAGLVDVIGALGGPAILVSNEVGLGIAPQLRSDVSSAIGRAASTARRLQRRTPSSP